MSSRTLVVAVVITLMGSAMAKADVEQAIATLEKFRAGDGSATLRMALAELRSRMSVGDAAIWKRLRGIIEDQKIPRRVRTEVLQVSIEKADENIASDMLSLFSAWSMSLAASDAGQPASDAAEADVRMMLLGQFVEALQTDTWHRRLDADARAPELLGRVILNTSPGTDVNHHAIAALAAIQGSPEIRRSTAERVITASPHSTEFDPRLLQLLDESSCERLRPLVRKSEDPDNFHFGAAAALAHLGDKKIRSLLEAISPTFQQKDRIRSGILNYYVWQIDVQQPSERLVEYIGRASLDDIEKRKWAIRRAIQLGVSKPALREAVLKYADSISADEKMSTRQGISSLKALCIELKVLDPGDLPGVKVAQRPPTP